MKILKYVFLLIVLAVIAVLVFIATQEGKYDIKKERTINVPKAVLFNYINDYRNWENVGILTDNDTTAVFSYSGITSGRGAISNWKVGSTAGTVRTIKVVENDSLIQKAVIDAQPSDIAWGFKEVAGGTRVSVRMKGELSFTDKAYAVLRGGVQDKLEATLDNGLASLNNFLVHELGTFDVDVTGLVNKTGTFYIGSSATTTIEGTRKAINEMLPKIMAFIKENNIATNGNPFTMFKGMDTAANTQTFIVCVPIKEEIYTTPGSEIEGGMLQPYNALKTTLKGDYSHLSKAWTAARKHINEKALQENPGGQRIEVYTRNILHTKKPSGWITDIYIPIGADTTPPPPTPVTGARATGTGTGTPAATTRPAATEPRPRPAATTTPPATAPANP